MVDGRPDEAPSSTVSVTLGGMTETCFGRFELMRACAWDLSRTGVARSGRGRWRHRTGSKLTVEDNLERDLARIAQIDIVLSLLQVLCKLTGLGFAAIARVTETRWIACAVRDEIAFGCRRAGSSKWPPRCVR